MSSCLEGADDLGFLAQELNMRKSSASQQRRTILDLGDGDYDIWEEFCHLRGTKFTPMSSAEKFFVRGEIKFRHGDTKGAIASYSRAIRFDPKFVRAYRRRGNAKKRIGD